MKRLLYLFPFLLLGGTVARAQDPMPLSLQDAIGYALKHNAAVKNARLDIDIQRAKNAEVTGIALPQVNARNEFNYYPRPVVSFFPAQILKAFDSSLRDLPSDAFVPVTFTPKFGNTLSGTASQVLFDGSVVVALQAKRTLMHLAQLGAQSTEEDVRYNVQRAYYALAIAYKQQGILNASLASARKIAHDQSVMRDQGFVEKIDVDRTTVQVNNLATDSLRTGNLILLSEQLLKFNMGMNIDQPLILTDTAVSNNINIAAQSLETEVNYSNRTDYNLLQDQLKLNEFDVRRYRYKAYPSLSAFGTGAFTYASNEFKEVATPSNYVSYALIGVQLNVPIFSGFQRTNQLKQAKLNVEKTRNNIDNLKLVIDLQSAQSRTVLRNSLLTLKNAERTLALSNSILDLSNKKYKAGVGSSLEINQAQTDLLISQNNYFQSLLEVINAQSDLQRALGQFK
jgi:outer membrane protein TolC